MAFRSRTLCLATSSLQQRIHFRIKLPVLQNTEECVLNWTSLKSLTLTYLFLRDEHVEQIITDCPQLESLKLCYFCGSHRLSKTSPKFRTLQLINHGNPYGDWDSTGDACFFKTVAPYVQHLKILGDFKDYCKIRVGDLLSLVHADRTFSVLEVFDKSTVKDHLLSIFRANELMVPSWFLETCLVKGCPCNTGNLKRLSGPSNMFPGDFHVGVEKGDVSLPLLDCKWLTINYWISEYSILGLGRLLRSTSYLENLTILPEAAISDVMLKEGDVFFPLLECKWLAISSSITRDSLPGLDNLLRSTPYLEKLMIAPDGTCGPLALDEAIYLSGDSYLSLQENIFKVSLQNLKNVKVISPCYGCIPRAEAAEFPQLLKFLLEHVINLEKMVIAPEHKKCNYCSTDISELMESVLAFPTTSKSAFVSLGSVNPQCYSR